MSERDLEDRRRYQRSTRKMRRTTHPYSRIEWEHDHIWTKHFVERQQMQQIGLLALRRREENTCVKHDNYKMQTTFFLLQLKWITILPVNISQPATVLKQRDTHRKENGMTFASAETN